MTSEKEKLRAQLIELAQHYQGEIVTYAAQRKPDRNPWKRRPSILDKAYEQELDKMAKQEPDTSS
ncbi:hypothetical protein GCM10009425_40460 [Pseudomonas asuensis]|uniref:Beta-ketoadipyl CoA thiolase n=1 Tax=Pseudomonas asuensis TaxID=1825787 RepID=A0ABQ2H2T8_9PSED|nr:hypothetical protein GCM10009425_40460 [Pseudomonas asuensis]